VVTVSHITSSSAQDRGPFHKSGAEQYSEEMKKVRDKQVGEHKSAMSKDFWQKFHDEFRHH